MSDTNIDKFKIIIDLNRGIVALKNKNNKNKCLQVKFNYDDKNGNPRSIFSKEDIEIAYDTMFNLYINEHPDLTDKDKVALKSRIRENIKDVSIYNALYGYGVKYKDKNKRLQLFIEAMLKSETYKKSDESYDEFLKREGELRRKELEKVGISIEYKLTREKDENGIYVNSKIASVVHQNAKESRYFAHSTYSPRIDNDTIDNGTEIKSNTKENGGIQTDLYKDSEETILKTHTLRDKIIGRSNRKKLLKGADIADAEQETQGNKNNAVHYKAKKGLITRIRESVKNPEFIKKIKSRIATGITVGAIAVAGIVGYNVFSNSKDDGEIVGKKYAHSQILEHRSRDKFNKKYNKQENTSTINSSEEINADIINMEDIKIASLHTDSTDRVFSENRENIANEVKENVDNKIKENVDNEVKEDVGNEVKEDVPEIKDEDVEESVVKMRDLLMVTLKVGFDTEFKMDTGKFYEAPDGTGKYGNYENINTDLKINMVDAIKDGNFVCYRASSEMSLADIYADADQILSIHTTTVDGAALGWNVDMDEIETTLLNSELSRIKEALPQEERDYIDSIDLDAPVDINNKDMIKHLAKVKQAQNSMREQEKNTKTDNTDDQIR